jgi:hypothetical protein
MSKKSSLVGYYPIKDLPQGADTPIKINYKEGEPPATVDLSAATAKLQVKQNYSGATIIELNSADGTIVLDAVSPNITLWFRKELTEDVTVFEEMIYDLEVTDSTGLTTRLLEGPFSISRQVTTD